MRAFAPVALLTLLAFPPPAAQPATDVDALMARVLARRDENWKKIEQYVLDERETFDLTGPDGGRLYGYRRDFAWFPRDGVFVRSPTRVNGVALSEDERQRAEASWIRRERRRDARQRQRAAGEGSTRSADDERPQSEGTGSGVPPGGAPGSESAAAALTASAALEPAFVSWAYFLRFRFEAGRYALVGRDLLDGRQVLRIEYYPTALFREGRTRPGRRTRERDPAVEDRMNKVSLVTLWVDPERQQILQYVFDDIDMDFLPGRAIVRVDDVRATMRMAQPFPDVWLPGDITMRFRLLLATGPVEAGYRVEYANYRQAAVGARVR